MAGMYVSYTLAVNYLSISEVRLTLRADDQELVGTQMAYRHEAILLGSAHNDPVLAGQLEGRAVGEIFSFKATYPDYDPQNIISVPLSALLACGLAEDDLEIGTVLNQDLLRGKVQIDNAPARLELMDIKEVDTQKVAVLDSNDPLRGLALQFNVEITEIRPPTEDEAKAATLGIRI